jgi:hypothetical protein
MTRTVKIRLLQASLIVATAITSGVFFFGDQVLGQIPIVIVGSVVVLVLAILPIISSVRVPGTEPN